MPHSNPTPSPKNQYPHVQIPKIPARIPQHNPSHCPLLSAHHPSPSPRFITLSIPSPKSRTPAPHVPLPLHLIRVSTSHPIASHRIHPARTPNPPSPSVRVENPDTHRRTSDSPTTAMRPATRACGRFFGPHSHRPHDGRGRQGGGRTLLRVVGIE
ncbi:hypothetical protein EJ04DRAFT_511651 [Polyplosphaeria fusca]|uniref:Uncharacterized protein n=1 Tax=Polyplosphaeria fusca TaxID=682080 RepID=A0A9P4R2L6_9PLEO|nr:hypothetical protein EJ04DRAFT_511651 [Polyplosphaeria fusca]